MSDPLEIRHPQQRDASHLRQFIETYPASGFDVATAWRVLTDVAQSNQDAIEVHLQGRLSAVFTVVPTGFGTSIADLLAWNGHALTAEDIVRVLRALAEQAHRQGSQAVEIGVEPWLAGAETVLNEVGFEWQYTMYGMSRPAALPAAVFAPPSPLIWRRCREEDIVAYHRMLQRTFVVPGVVIPPLESTAEYQRKHPSWVLADQDRLAGFVNVKVYEQDGKRVGEVASIGRDPDFQGHHLGEVLMSKALSELQQQPLDEICLVVAAINKRALGLYQRFDFAITDQTEFYRKAL
ncbi:ribosomal protein S18 acetylase RimI-like enzyme [Chitinivorax tropicus]|uniref:Ribosomal protein S18 acetylase RimI-like enzyme n=1 Tax=Chitinivorax tropicus TaxID=714531 RepID=A0A840MTV6_9PROT|nr:N-acetyltransferase [Chitinivorax tropicus]MBB5019723.1 ribosomal protein S18 acetylase RimI-like enzyme [Chitinivorax tropicus]